MSLTFEEQLAVAKGEARTGFERQLKMGYRGFAEEYARRTGRYPHPSVVEKWRRGQRQQFETSLSKWETEAKTTRKAELATWKADILRQYPSPKYRVEWTDEGATIYEAATRKLTAEEQVAMLGEWKQELHKQYPERIFDVTFIKQTGEEGWKAVITKRSDVALADWRRQLTKKYPPHRYDIEWTDVGAKIYEKVTGVPTFVERGLVKAQQYEMKQYRQLTQEIVFAPPASIERGFHKAQQVEAKQMMEQLQRPAYKPKQLSEFYMEQKGLRKGVEFAPIERAREYAYLHPERVWHPTSLSEALLEFGKTEPLPQIWRTGPFTKPKLVFEPVRPLAGVAGFVAYPETLIYAGMTWLGLEPIFRPPPPLKEGPPEYRLGYVTSMVVGSIVLTELIAKTPIPKWEAKIWQKTIGERAEAWLTKQYLTKGPMEWKGFTEKVVMKLTGAKPYVAPQVVSVTVAGEPPYSLLPKFGLKTGLVRYDVEAARTMAWTLAETPKTSGLLMPKLTTKLATTWAKEQLVSVGMGGLSYALVQEELMMEPKMPYIPTEVYGTKTRMVVLPLLAPTIEPKMPYIPKQLSALMVKEHQLTRITPIVEPMVTQIQRQKQISIQKEMQMQVSISQLATKQMETQMTKQMQLTKQVPLQIVTPAQVQRTMLEPPRQIPQMTRDYGPKRRRRKRRVRDPFKLYEEFVYPIATAKEFYKKVVK